MVGADIRADIPNISLTIFAFCTGEGKMEHPDARAKMGLQDALEVLP